MERCLKIVLFISLLSRLIYWYDHPQVITFPDSHGYYGTGQQMLERYVFVDESRTPLYPIFLQLPNLLGRNGKIEFGSLEFQKKMTLVTLSQTLFGILSLYLLYKILSKLKIKKGWSCIFTLFTGLNIMVFATEKTLMTETLSTFFLMILIFILLNLISSKNNFTFWNLASILLLFVLGFLLRPVYLLLPLIIVPILPLLYYERKILIKSLLLIVAYLTIIGIYIIFNGKYNGYYGASRILDINLFGKILEYNLNLASANKSFLYAKILEYKKITNNPQPWYFLAYLDPSYHLNKLLLNELRSFNSQVIKSNLPTYLYRGLLHLPAAMLETNASVVLKEQTESFISFLLNQLYRFYSLMQYFSLFFWLGFLIILFQFFKRRNKEYGVLLIIAAVAFYQIATSVFLSYGEFGRLISSAQPLIYLISFYTLSKIIHLLKNF